MVIIAKTVTQVIIDMMIYKISENVYYAGRCVPMVKQSADLPELLYLSAPENVKKFFGAVKLWRIQNQKHNTHYDELDPR